MMIVTALIGFGWWGQHIARRLKNHPDFDICGVVEPAPELHTIIENLGLNVALSYEAVLNDPSVQAVILTSPNNLHDSQILEAVAAGKHVFCEKTLSLNAHGARATRGPQAVNPGGLFHA